MGLRHPGGVSSVTGLTSSAQDYLKVVWGLGEWSSEPVTAGVLAERLGLRVSTVSDGVRKLTERGLLDHAPYGQIRLTDAGRAHAVLMVRRHRVIETFLVGVLGYRWDQVHEEADVLEHAVSDLMVERMHEVLGHPATDPHGDPIPSAAGVLEVPDAVRLSDVDVDADDAAGGRRTVLRVSDADSGVLRFLGERGVVPGAVLEVERQPPSAGELLVRAEGTGELVTLDRAGAARAVWVSRGA